MTASVLVFLMQAGFLALEAGLTRTKNAINVAIKNLADFAISTVVFWSFGFAIMFGGTFGGWLGTDTFFLSFDETQAWPTVFFTFQVMFCGTAVTILSGAVAERLRFGIYLLLAVLVAGFTYPVFGHWAWNGLDVGEANGWLAELGFVDFAGSTVVHSVGGWTALAVLVIIGPRIGRFPDDGPPRRIQGSNLPLATLGTLLLWVGWLGFNGGSTLSIGPDVGRVIANTVLAGSTGLVAATLLGYWRSGRPEIDSFINGTLGGLVAITAGAFAVDSVAAAGIGAVGGLVAMGAAILLEKVRIDDAVGAVPVHLGAGIWGTLAVGLFGELDLLDTGLSRMEQIGVQLVGIAACAALVFPVTYLVMRAVSRITPLRVSAEAEEIGLNVHEHGATSELHDFVSVMDTQARTGDLSLRAPVEPFTLIGQIATGYNMLMGSLQDKQTEIRGYHDHLEETVKDRTSELETKNLELEGLSTKLSKYLSPQVYASIFRGEQSVEIASKRKKLTIFFSDIASFTETTDHMESEELTNLLNHYLTEMSTIALEYGATIDKYVGDAILAFFGDPETKGVKEDAQACVLMAIAMQRRMRTLEQEWWDEGLDRPFRIRVGINTGFCTVGNFGSKDRMDYTIIGNEVNLAARLESSSELGGILMAHETYSLVKDIIAADEQEPLTVKGFTQPVGNYKVVGAYDELVGEGRLLHKEKDGVKLEVNWGKQDRAAAIETIKGFLAELED
jgi:Amt family ammonium transporter